MFSFVPSTPLGAHHRSLGGIVAVLAVAALVAGCTTAPSSVPRAATLSASPTSSTAESSAPRTTARTSSKLLGGKAPVGQASSDCPGSVTANPGLLGESDGGTELLK